MLIRSSVEPRARPSKRAQALYRVGGRGRPTARCEVRRRTSPRVTSGVGTRIGCSYMAMSGDVGVGLELGVG